MMRDSAQRPLMMRGTKVLMGLLMRDAAQRPLMMRECQGLGTDFRRFSGTVRIFDGGIYPFFIINKDNKSPRQCCMIHIYGIG